MGELTLEQKRAALDAAVGSETLSRSERLKSLLRFIGDAEIEGRSAQINEYVIGVHALGRPEGYSTIDDSSVRSRMSELRQRLDRFYAIEAQNAPVRIEIPKGSHCPRFVRRGGFSPPPQTPGSRFSRDLLLGLMVGVLIGTAAFLAMSAGRSSAGVDWSQDLQTFWEPFLEPGTRTLLAYESRLFLGSGPSVVVRDYRVNDMEATDSSQELAAIRGALHLPQFRENRNYTEFGFVPTAVLLSRLLTSRHADFIAKRTSELTPTDIRENNLIFLGKPATDAEISHFIPRTEFVDEGPRIRVLHPRPGELPEYVESYDPRNPGSWSEKYALVTFGAGPENSAGRRRPVLCLAASGAEHPWAVATFLTSPSMISGLVKRLVRDRKMPAAYQVLLRARFKAQAPIQVECVTDRVLESGRYGRGRDTESTGNK